MILGPSVNVHRVAAGGRNFEYLSGEALLLGIQGPRVVIRGGPCRECMSEGVCVCVCAHALFVDFECV